MNKILNIRGWVLLESVVPMALVGHMLMDLYYAQIICREAQVRNGIENTEGTVHHLPAILSCDSFLAFLDANPAADVIADYFKGSYILNSMGGNFNEGSNYASAIHRDIRSFHSNCPMLNTLVMLDDFTAENGATWLMHGSHTLSERPTEAEFHAEAEQITAPAGSILVWVSNLWHKAGENKTGKPRRIVTPIFTYPWYKQGFDYPRAIGYDADLAPTLRQVLGYNARVPATFDEWYQPPEKRMYRGDQG